MTRVVLLGDSIRLHYQPYVADALASLSYEVQGPRENGGTSANLLAHLEAWALAPEPDLVHLNPGLHDLRRDPATDRPQVALADYKANVDLLLSRLAEAGVPAIWATCTPIDQAWHDAARFSRRREADVAAYNAAARSVAEARGVPVNDLFAAVEAAGRGRMLAADGVHFTRDGYRFLAEWVAYAIRHDDRLSYESELA